jgi:hypothetical protein
LIYSVRPAAHPDVEIFVIDTHVLLAGQTIYEDVLAEDGSEVESTGHAADRARAQYDGMAR